MDGSRGATEAATDLNMNLYSNNPSIKEHVDRLLEAHVGGLLRDLHVQEVSINSRGQVYEARGDGAMPTPATPWKPRSATARAARCATSGGTSSG